MGCALSCGGINASNLYKVADAMVAQGLPELGYKYVSLDDCWAKSRDPETVTLLVSEPNTATRAFLSVRCNIYGRG